MREKLRAEKQTGLKSPEAWSQGVTGNDYLDQTMMQAMDDKPPSTDTSYRGGRWLISTSTGSLIIINFMSPKRSALLITC
jgi:hypothetical protein